MKPRLNPGLLFFLHLVAASRPEDERRISRFLFVAGSYSTIFLTTGSACYD